VDNKTFNTKDLKEKDLEEKERMKYDGIRSAYSYNYDPKLIK